MKPVTFVTLCSFGSMLLLLSGCGKDFTGFGELDGWGGYTKQYGDVNVGLDNSVGLCSYTGGCMPNNNDKDIDVSSFKGTKSSGVQDDQ